MLYAQFYQRSALDGITLVEACGDRAVIILDGRHNSRTNGEIAAEECVKRGYSAWSIHRGESFTRSQKVAGPWSVSSGKKIADPWGLSRLG